MANSLNRVLIIGRVGKDPEVRVSAGGMAIAKLTVATSFKKKDKTEETEWHSITLFDKMAQIINNYVKKGNRIFIEGRVKTDMWEKDGVKHYRTGIIGENIILLESKPALNGAEPAEREYHAEQRANESINDNNEDVPFGG